MFAFAYLVSTLLVRLIDDTFCFPLLKACDSLVGGALGLLRGYVLMMLLATMVPLVLNMLQIQLIHDLVDGSAFLKHFYPETGSSAGSGRSCKKRKTERKRAEAAWGSRIGKKSCAVVREERKSLCFRVRQDGTVEIRAPRLCPDFLIELFLRRNRERIARQRNEGAGARGGAVCDRAARGQGRCRCCPRRRRAEGRGWKGLRLSAGGHAGGADRAATGIYKEQAHAYLPLRAEEWAAHFGIEIRGVKITSARKRWGSCSSRGGLNFSWRLMMAPPEAIDAVIIHELMHRIEFNHSRPSARWKKKNVPNYEACQRQLRGDGAAFQRHLERKKTPSGRTCGRRLA